MTKPYSTLTGAKLKTECCNAVMWALGFKPKVYQILLQEAAPDRIQFLINTNLYDYDRYFENGVECGRLTISPVFPIVVDDKIALLKDEYRHKLVIKDGER